MAARSQASNDRHAYIPTGARQALAQHMQQSAPAHLKKYMGPNKPAYVPQRAQQELTAFMQKTMPAHLQQYAGAYVQQNVVDGSVPMAKPTPSHGPAPLPEKRNLSHSGDIATSQADATQYLNLFQTEAATQATPGANAPDYPPATSQSPYDFFMNSGEPQKPSRVNFSGSSMTKRVLLVALAAVVLMIAFAVLKSVVGGSSNYPALLGVAQDQQELIHLATLGTQSATTEATKNFSATTLLSLQSEQTELVSYLKTNGHKVNGKALSLKISKTMDAQLDAAASASTFDETYKGVVQDTLKSYQSDLQKAYTGTKGPKGRTLLNNDYKAAQLLLQQLGS